MTPQEAVEVLTETLGFSVPELARALEVSDRTVKRWEADGPISTESRERLFDLVRVTAKLADFELPPRNIHAWFFYRNPFLGEERPIDALSSGGYLAAQPALAGIANSPYL